MYNIYTHSKHTGFTAHLPAYLPCPALCPQNLCALERHSLCAEQTSPYRLSYPHAHARNVASNRKHGEVCACSDVTGACPEELVDGRFGDGSAWPSGDRDEAQLAFLSL